MFLSDSEMFKEEVAKKATFFFPNTQSINSNEIENVERYFRLFVGAMDGFNEQLTIIGQWETAVDTGMIDGNTKFSNAIILCTKKETISWLPQMTNLEQINKVCKSGDKFWCNNDEHITVIELQTPYIMYIQTTAVIPLACQWLYKDNVTKESWDLTKRISKLLTQPIDFSQKISEIEDLLGLKEKYKSSIFNMVVDDFNKACVVKYDEKIREHEVAIEDLLREIQRRNSKIDELTWLIMKNKEYAKRGQEIADYMSKNNALVPLIDGNAAGRPTFTYGVKTTLSNWEVERYDKVKSSVVRDTETRAPLTALRRYNLVDDFWDSIFKEHIINICGVFSIDWNTRNILARRERDFDYNTLGDNCIPNEHLARHACTGDYSYMIIDAITQGMWEQAIELTIASTANINPVEYGPTFSHFVDRILSNDWEKKFLTDPKTGEFKSPNMVASEILAKRERRV